MSKIGCKQRGSKIKENIKGASSINFEGSNTIVNPTYQVET